MTDFYTKAVLTVIAAALVAIVTQNMIRPVGAQVQRVTICDPLENRCALVRGVPGFGTGSLWVGQ